MNTTYLVPYAYTGSSSVALEYHLFSCKKDMRTMICKKYAAYEVKSVDRMLITALHAGMIITAKLKGNDADYLRVIAPNGKAAYAFKCSMQHMD